LLDTIVHTGALPSTMERSVKHMRSWLRPIRVSARDLRAIPTSRNHAHLVFAHDQFENRAAPAAEVRP